VYQSKTLDDWAAYATFDDHASSIVPFADIPISSKTLAIASSDRSSKKRKEALTEDVLENASMSSTLDPSDGATVASATSDPISSERQDMAETYDSPSSLSNHPTVSMVPSFPRLERQGVDTESSSAPQSLAYLRSPNSGEIRQDGQESSSPSNLFGIKESLEVDQVQFNPVPVAAGPITEEAHRIRDYFGITETPSMQPEAIPSTANSEALLDEDSL
jgi:hypothetical protein